MKQRLLILLFAFMTIMSAMAYDFEYEGIYYSFNNDGSYCVSVVSSGSYNCYSGDLVIPDKVYYNYYPCTVTSIGNNAFQNCSYSLTSVEIPNSVTSIGRDAFNRCYALTSVKMSNSVKSIGQNAFYECKALTSIEIPSTVTKIERGAFYNCSGLKQVHISDLSSWCKIDFYSYDSNPVCYAHYLYLNDVRIYNLVIPSTVTKISPYAFSNNYVESVEIPSTVTTIGEGAFEKCYQLTSVVMPESVKSIGSSAFSGCSSLTSIEIPNTVTSIGSSAFSGCIRLTSIEIPNTVTSIGDYVFQGCKGLTSIEIPNTVTSIGSSAFSGCSSLTSIEIPNTVTSIGNDAFKGCTGLASIEIPKSVTLIKSGAFYGCTGLTELNFNATDCTCSTVYVDDEIFGKCENLINVKIGENVTKIPEFLFTCCPSLSTIKIPNSVTIIGRYAFSQCNALTSIDLPNTLTTIGDHAFFECSALTSFEIPNSVTTIGEYVFTGCSSLESFTGKFASDDHRCLIIDGVLNAFAPGNLTSYIIPDSITSIGTGAFMYCTDLVSVGIPNTVTSIGGYAFDNCQNILEIVVPASVTTIEEYAFEFCTGLTSIELPVSVTSIGNDAFYYCLEIASIKINNDNPANINLGTSVFSNVPTSTCVLYVPKGSKELYASASQWKAFTNIKEFTPAVALIDGTPYTNDEDKVCETITYTRTFSSDNWQALYLPFEMEYNDWAAQGEIAKLNNVYQYDTDGDGTLDRTVIVFDRVTDHVNANTPYVFRPKAAGEVVFTVSNATLFAAPVTDASVWCASTEKLYTIFGNYEVKEGLAAQEAYALSPAGQFVRAASAEQTLKPYRIYMLITDKNYSGSSTKAPALISISVDGETTGIDDVEIIQQVDDRYYDILGRPVVNPQQGIYIHDGKKVMIK